MHYYTGFRHTGLRHTGFGRIGLALAILVLASGAAFAQVKPSPSPSAAPATSGANPDAARLAWLEKMVKYLQGEVTALRTQVRALERLQNGGAGTARGGVPGGVEAKIAELTRKLEGHTHEYLLEGRAGDGSIQAVPSASFPGSGLNSTGGARVGRAIIH